MDTDSIRRGRSGGELGGRTAAIVCVEEKRERGGAEDPDGGGAEHMKYFLAAATGDGAGIAGGEKIFPFAEEEDAEIFAASGEGFFPTEGAIIFDERGGDGARIGCDGTGEVPFSPAVPGPDGFVKMGVWLHEQIGWLMYWRRGWLTPPAR